MFSSNKSLIVATLLTGTAVATGTLIYGVFSKKEKDLLILDGTLPPVLGSGLLPPPATYVMTTPPPNDIPGIRRLKIQRPTITGAGTTQGQGDEEFYLTGTRSSELIREPVEARIETFPTVSLEEAAEGALAVDEWGFQVVQSYLNQALGDDNALKARMSALLEKLESMAGDYDLGTISDAANLIIEAGARAHWSAFMSPFVLDKSFKLQEGAIGWDFGPSELKPYDKFTRVSANSEMLQGDKKNDEGSSNGSSILRNGVRNVEQFVASGLKNGMYRVVILTAPRSNGTEPLYPFGVDLKRNGGKLNMVDTRATDDQVPLMRLATDGPGRLSGPGTADEATSDDAFDNSSRDSSYNSTSETLYSLGPVTPVSISADSLLSANRNMLGHSLQSLRLIEPLAKSGDFAPFYQASGGGSSAPESGHMLVTRAEVVDGTLRIDFRQLGGQDTYVTAVIIYPEPDVDITEVLTAEIVEFIENIAPASGLPENAEDVMTANLPIVSVEEVFADNSTGLPTEEAEAATPEAEPEPAGQTTATPEPEPAQSPAPEPDPEPEPVDVVAEDVTVLEPEPEPPAPEPEPEPPAPEPEPEPPAPEPEPEPPAPEPEPEPPAPEPEPPAPEPKELVLDAGGGSDGVYDPVLLGEDFLLDGCGSTFEDELLCSLTSTSEFEIVWILNGEEIGTGQQLLVQTGEDTDFDTTGNISISAQIRYDGRLLEDGEILNVLTGGSLFLPGDIILTSLDTAMIRVYTVAEPAAFFLLAPGLFYLARRERRRRKIKNPI